jgi:glycosidase
MGDMDRRVFYEIFIRSFYDSNGDGIGDVNGITMKLDYLKSLGITGIWITPFHPSPSYHKYDVTDYFGVDKEYGTLDDYIKLVAEAHKRNIIVLLDLVANHCSSQNKWFKAAVDDDNTFRNFYLWTDDEDEMKEPNWYLPKDSLGNVIEGEAYYGFFSRYMPDFDYDNEEVRATIIEIGNWWLREANVDGFRLDAAQHIYDAENPGDNVDWWKEFTDAMKKTKPGVITIGECWNKYPLVSQYLTSLTGCFNFELSWNLLKILQEEKNEGTAELVTTIRNSYSEVSKTFVDPIFLSNHDVNRIMSDLGNNAAKAKLAACIYLTLPGTPFVYYGEELGMTGMKPDSLIREPFLWNKKGKDKGQTAWEKQIYSTYENVKPLSDQMKDSSSIFNLYKKLIRLRNSNSVFTSRNFDAADLGNEQLLCYKRADGNKDVLVINNLSGNMISGTLPAQYVQFTKILFSNNGASLKANQYSLHPYSTLIISKSN